MVVLNQEVNLQKDLSPRLFDKLLDILPWKIKFQLDAFICDDMLYVNYDIIPSNYAWIVENCVDFLNLDEKDDKIHNQNKVTIIFDLCSYTLTVIRD